MRNIDPELLAEGTIHLFSLLVLSHSGLALWKPVELFLEIPLEECLDVSVTLKIVYQVWKES